MVSDLAIVGVTVWWFRELNSFLCRNQGLGSRHMSGPLSELLGVSFSPASGFDLVRRRR